MSGNFIITCQNNVSIKIPRTLVPIQEINIPPGNKTLIPNEVNYGTLFALNQDAEDLDEDIPIAFNKQPIDADILTSLLRILERFQQHPFTAKRGPTDPNKMEMLKPSEYGQFLEFVPEVHLNLAKVMQLCILSNFLLLRPVTDLCALYAVKHILSKPIDKLHELGPTPDTPFTKEDEESVEKRYPGLSLDASPPIPTPPATQETEAPAAKRVREEESNMEEEE